MIMMVLAVVMLFFMLSGGVPLLASSCTLSTFQYPWILIKRPSSIYIILNFIIICLLSCSSFCLQLNLLLSKPKVTKLDSTTSHAIPFFGDDDMWWAGIIDGEGETISPATWKVKDEHTEEEMKDDVAVEKEVVEEEEEEEDTLDGTWQAIMEAKNKCGGPQLKKRETWSSGGGSDLKSWRTFTKAGLQKEQVALTYHDELKKRADAFIAQFVHNIRLQRLESDQRFMDMINRGH